MTRPGSDTATVASADPDGWLPGSVPGFKLAPGPSHDNCHGSGQALNQALSQNPRDWTERTRDRKNIVCPIQRWPRSDVITTVLIYIDIIKYNDWGDASKRIWAGICIC